VFNVTLGALAVGMPVTGSGIVPGTVVTGVVGGGSSGGGAGAYTVGVVQNVPPFSTASASGTAFSGSISGTTLTVTSVAGGPPLGVGSPVVGPGVLPGTVVTAVGAGSSGGVGTYTVGVPQTVTAAPLSGGGAMPPPPSPPALPPSSSSPPAAGGGANAGAGTDTTLVGGVGGGGAALVALAAAVGVMLLRRRRTADAAVRGRKRVTKGKRQKPLKGSRAQVTAPPPAQPPGDPPAYAFTPFGSAAGGAFLVENPLAQKRLGREK